MIRDVRSMFLQHEDSEAIDKRCVFEATFTIVLLLRGPVIGPRACNCPDVLIVHTKNGVRENYQPDARVS